MSVMVFRQLNATVGLLKQCPECGGETLIPVASREGANFFCQDCVSCWHVERGRTHQVDPQTCPGCQLGTTRCIERSDVFHSRSGMTTREGPRESGREDEMKWDDIEWELCCSTREAGIGSFSLLGF